MQHNHSYGPVMGSDLRVGDVVGVGWSAHGDTIIAVRPYTGPLAPFFQGGANLISFAKNKRNAVVENNTVYHVISRGPKKLVCVPQETQMMARVIRMFGDNR